LVDMFMFIVMDSIFATTVGNNLTKNKIQEGIKITWEDQTG
jgi:hypothetical protein